MSRVFITARQAMALEQVRFVDATWSLKDLTLGPKVFKEGRLPGAVFFDLEELSGTITDKTGRHPLPEFQKFHSWIEASALEKTDSIITYGDAAARVWWMLFTLGYQKVNILEGGRASWEKNDGPIETGDPKSYTSSKIELQNTWGDVTVQRENVLSFDKIIDCRSKERYSSTTEPCFPDPKPGHIEGAVNHPFSSNFDENGAVLAEDKLRAHCESTLSGVPVDKSVVYCGSGVTACVTAASMVHAGVGLPKMYVGSWSEWNKYI
eukprot:TRINITY_DN33692_c0_g1_i1.p1 TRINITY_DN33692_c0_g1~~TRINITY_DN33692_c0_g1_i1.p1  ORF type:complete len:265 (+),score=47.08 TRINITY_DN33692_c0_g1_i1:57-851(+)